MPSERVQRRIERLLDQAEEAVEARDWTSVRDAAGAVLRVDPDNEDAASFLQMAGDEAPAEPDERTDAPAPPPTQSTDEPTSFANGRYVVKSLLGEGGKKKVYLAHDTTLDRDVAFGLIKAEGLDAASRQRITREAQAMARLGDHPNLMPIFDLGDEAGLPYMVQPLMGGGDVEGLIEGAEDGKLLLEDALRIASEMCSGLDFAHSQGVVHRDLKPGNVWLTGDGAVRIGDFELAISLDRSRLTQEKMMIGTVSYMPPEQATGGEATAKSDLYSLGAMLYEMVTGRPPFLGDDEIAIISQHVNTPPVAPAWLNPEVPAQLDTLILRLLEKDPAARPESGSDVLTALGDIDLSVMTDHEDSEGVSLDSMAGGVFVGRHQEMDQLKSELEKALSGRGGMMTLVGEPGIGKSRTALELETYAGMRNAQVLWGRCYEEEGAPPYWPWVQTIRSYVRNSDPEALRSNMGSTASVIAEIVADVKEQLPEVEPPPDIEDPNRKRFRLFDSITTFLKSAADVKPLVLILDDLHWADRPSLMLLEFIARELASSRILLVGTYRDMELNRRHPLSVTLGDLGRERLFERVILRGISKSDVRRFIEIAAGINPPEGLVESVHTQTEGNPLFVTETVRLFIQEGDLTPERLASTDSWTMRAPEGVTQAIGRRLDRLSQRANSVLTTAAVIGRQFTLAQLESIEDEVSEDRLLDVLDEALAARVIEELPDEIGRYQFTHALIQQTLAEELSAARVVRLHARIAEALEQLYVDDIETHVGELAEHFTEADAILGPEKGARYLITAAQQAFEALSFEDARANFERARELAEQLDDKALLAPILEGLGYSTYNTGSISDEYWPLIEQAFNIYVSLGDTKSAVRIGRYPAPAYNTEAQLALYRNALTLAEPESVDAGWILSKIAYTEGNLDRWAESQKSANRAHQIAIHQSNARLAAWSLGRALQPALHAGDLDEALYYYEQSMAHIAAADDVDVETHIYFCGSLIYLILGDGEQARDLSERALESAHKSRSINRIRSALIGQSLVAYAFGSWDKAIQRIEEFEKTPGFELGPIGQAIRMAVESEAGSTEYKDSSFDAVIAASKANVERKRFEPFAGSFILASCLLRNGINTGDERAIDASDELTQSMIEYPPSTASEQGIIAKFKSVRDLMVANTPIDDVNVFQSASRLEFVDWTNGVYWSPMIAQGRIFGLNAKVQGDVDTAAVEFTRAIEECRKAGYKPELAATCVDYAQMLIERGAEADAEKITALQDEAIAITQKLGMKPLMERVLAQREMMKA